MLSYASGDVRRDQAGKPLRSPSLTSGKPSADPAATWCAEPQTRSTVARAVDALWHAIGQLLPLMACEPGKWYRNLHSRGYANQVGMGCTTLEGRDVMGCRRRRAQKLAEWQATQEQRVQ